jgi:phenylpropionate dioxygenase-like ring-hydroxylating dioxygenase large terminal subunit
MNEAAQCKRPLWLENCWYQAAWSSEFETRSLLARTILDREILLFRDSNGTLSAIEDRCPHRFAPLSAGTVQDGVVRCGYHGLGFDGRGRCVLNPHGAITSAMQVRHYPVVERHQAAWVWMGPKEADPSLLPYLNFIDEAPATAKFTGYMDTAANYQLLTDNILDLSHADYLHPHSLGGIMTGAKTTMREENQEFIIEWLSSNCVPPPAFLSMVPPPERADIWTQVRWRAPAVMVLGTGANPAGKPRDAAKEAWTLHNMTPATSVRSHYFFCSTRKFNVYDANFNRMLCDLITEAFRSEDKPMLEKQQRAMGTADLWSLKPVLLGIDSGAVKVRRLLEKMIEAEQCPNSSVLRDRSIQ